MRACASLAVVFLGACTASFAQTLPYQLPPPALLPLGFEWLAVPPVHQVPSLNQWAPPGGSCGDLMLVEYQAKLRDYEERAHKSGSYEETLRLLKEETEYINQFRERMRAPVYGWAPYRFGMHPEDPLCTR